ncbi:MAG: hypothetical protein ACM3Q1_12770 [Bacteroidales bacterium]
MAREAGALSVGAYVAVLLVALWRRWFAVEGPAVDTSNEATPSQKIVVAASLMLMGIHVALLVFGPAHASRLNETEAYSHLVSLENLTLPLLLQLYVLAGARNPLRLPLLAALLLGMSLSPFRAMVMALYLFALLLPLASSMWTQWRHKAGCGWKAIGRQALLAALVGVAILQAGAQDTKTRSPTLLAIGLGLAEIPPQHPLPAEALATIKAQREASAKAGTGQTQTQPAKTAAQKLMPPTDLGGRLSQRIAFPLYQAAIAAHLAESETDMPSLRDQLLRKFRLSDAPNLEEYLFRHIYGGQGHGETTSLTYGEALAYFPAHPLLWMIAVPLLMVLAWRMFVRKGMDYGTLFGIQLWRTSFSGLFPILPALLLQSAGLWLMHRFPLTRWRTAARLALGLALAGALLLEAWTLISLLSGRRDILYARYELERGCWLESPYMVPSAMVEVGKAHALPMSPVLVNVHRTALVMAFPYGRAASPLLEDTRGAIAKNARCQDDPKGRPAPEAIRVLDSQVVGRQPILLDLILFCCLLAATWWSWRPLRQQNPR